MVAPEHASVLAKNRRRNTLWRTALAASLCLSTLGPLPGLPSLELVQGRLGFYLAALPLVVLLLVELARSTRDLLDLPRRHTALCAASAAVVLAGVASAIFAADRTAAFASAARSALVLGFLILVVDATLSDPDLRRTLGRVGAGIILVHLALFALGLAWTPATPVFFDTTLHQYLESLPRFTGLGAGPFGTGAMLLASAGLARHLGGAKTRAAITAVAFALVVATLSFATLVLPLALLAAVPIPRWPKRAAMLLAAAAAIAVLWWQPLQIECGGFERRLGAPHPGYFTDGNGPLYMPIGAVGTDSCHVTFRPNLYRLLSARSVRCFLEHPLVGVGGRNHPESCPVKTMNTLGGWSTGRLAHNQYGAWFAEGGALGVFCLAALGWALILRHRWSLGEPLACGLLIAYLTAAFAGEILLQLPFAAWVGTLFAPSRVEKPGASLR
jgi:hypothetical protein